jgi:hypothetical protein
MPGDPTPIPAAPGRHLAPPARAKQKAPPLKLTLGNGHRHDDLAIWYHRRQKGSDATVIDRRQYIAGRRIEHMMETIMDHRGIKAFDMTIPVVDTSHSERSGGYGPELREALLLFDRLRAHLGSFDLAYLTNFLGGMGIHGAMLHEAGHPWRYEPDHDKDENGEYPDLLAAPGILPANNLPPRERAFHSKHKVPHEVGFGIDRRKAATDRATAAREQAVRESKAEIKREAARDELESDLRPWSESGYQPGYGADLDVVEINEVWTKALESDRNPDKPDPAVDALRKMLRTNPPPVYDDMRDAGSRNISANVRNDDVIAGGAVIDIGDIENLHPWTTVDRAKQVFTANEIRQGSLRGRNLLSRAAELFEINDARRNDTTAVITVDQLTDLRSIPFEVDEFQEMHAARH